MCRDISNTTVCLLCPLGNKPLGHSLYPDGIASASVGKTNRLPVFLQHQMLAFFHKHVFKGGDRIKQEKQWMKTEKKRKPNRELCWSHVLGEKRLPDKRK